MTLVREPGEAALLESGLADLTALGHRVFVTDGTSAPVFAQRLAQLGGLDVRRSAHGPGLVAQVQTSVEAAERSGVEFICYTEPDKVAFFHEGLPRLLDALPDDDRVGIVVASRSPRAMDTFPPVQQYAERAINDLTGHLLGAAGDYSYGPFVMRAALARAVLAAPLDVGWGWRHFLFGTASRLGLGVRHLVGDFTCPDDQRGETHAERLHRLRQLEQNTRGLLRSLDDAAGQPGGLARRSPRS